MEGQVPESWLQRFKGQIEEDKIYCIKHFKVQNAKNMFRTTAHDYMAVFTPYTRLQEIIPAPSAFPMYAYSAVPFHMLETRINNDQLTSGTSAITCKATTPHTHCPSTLHKCMQMTAYHAFSSLKLTSYFYCRCRRYCHCLHPLR